MCVFVCLIDCLCFCVFVSERVLVRVSSVLLSLCSSVVVPVFLLLSVRLVFCLLFFLSY